MPQIGPDRISPPLPSPAHQTVVLAASSNDNGLLHQELVDFELPPGLGWTTRGAVAGTGTSSGAASGAVLRTNDVSFCLEPFPWVGADRRKGKAAEVARRVQLHQFWRASAKFQLPVRVPAEGAVLSAGLRAADAPAAPCALRFGSEAGPPEGGLEQCRYAFPHGERTAPSLSKGCWAWCEGTLSSSNAGVSLVQTRLP